MIDPNRGAGTPEDAHAVYATWLRTHPAYDNAGFDQLCVDHPALANDLRKLDELAELAKSLVRSPPFQQSLRECFGEEAEVNLTLDEAATVTEDNKRTMVDATAR